MTFMTIKTTYIQTDRQTDKWCTDRQTDSQTDRQTNDEQTDGQTQSGQSKSVGTKREHSPCVEAIYIFYVVPTVPMARF